MTAFVVLAADGGLFGIYFGEDQAKKRLAELIEWDWNNDKQYSIVKVQVKFPGEDA